MTSFGSSPPLAAPGSAPRVILEALAHRGELASLEFQEAQVHGFRTLLITGFAGMLLLLGGFAGTFALAAAVWQREDRGLILTLVTLAYLGAAAALGFWAQRRLTQWKPFAETRRQFNADCSCLHEVMSSSSR